MDESAFNREAELLMSLEVGDLLMSKVGKDLRVVVSERKTKSGKRELLLSGYVYHILDLIVEKEFILLSKNK